jgi:hypothetical protein
MTETKSLRMKGSLGLVWDQFTGAGSFLALMMVGPVARLNIRTVKDDEERLADNEIWLRPRQLSVFGGRHLGGSGAVGARQPAHTKGGLFDGGRDTSRPKTINLCSSSTA